jgi:hypothetical protein
MYIFFYISSTEKTLRLNVLSSYHEGPEKATRGGVNGSQSKFLTEFGLCPKINPNPQHAKSSGAETG